MGSVYQVSYGIAPLGVRHQKQPNRASDWAVVLLEYSGLDQRRV